MKEEIDTNKAFGVTIGLLALVITSYSLGINVKTSSSPWYHFFLLICGVILIAAGIIRLIWKNEKRAGNKK